MILPDKLRVTVGDKKFQIMSLCHTTIPTKLPGSQRSEKVDKASQGVSVECNNMWIYLCVIICGFTEIF